MDKICSKGAQGMDAFLVQRAMFVARAAELHDVANLIHEYRAVDRLAATAGGAGPGGAWSHERRRIESTLRSFIAGQPLTVAKRQTGYRTGIAGEG
jgi:hypothetical protein